MKNLILSSFILLLAFGCATAQESYRSVFGEQQTSWNITGYGQTIVAESFHTDSFSIAGDTILNGLTSKLLKKYSSFNDGQWTDMGFIYLVREDTTSGMVWVSYPLWESPHLVQDMSLTEADSFYLAGVFEWAHVDTIYLDNEGRKVIELDYMTGMGLPFTMIEGIGPNVGIIHPHDMMPLYDSECPVLLCHHKDGEAVYVNNHPAHAGQCGLLETAPLTADAGVDTVLCERDLFNGPPYFIGGSPSANGGSGEYSYEWTLSPSVYVPNPELPSLVYTASDFLSDTTSPNPRALQGWMPAPGVPKFFFVLKVSDSMGNTDYDTLLLVNYGLTLSTTPTPVTTTFAGAEETIHLVPFELGCPPYLLEWQGNGYLGDTVDFDVWDVNSLSKTVIIPDTSGQLVYGAYVTDSVGGCRSFVSAFPTFVVESVGIENQPLVDRMTWSVLDKDVLLSAKDAIRSIRVFDLLGRTVPVSHVATDAYAVKLGFPRTGIYFIHVFFSHHSETIKIYIP